MFKCKVSFCSKQLPEHQVLLSKSGIVSVKTRRCLKGELLHLTFNLWREVKQRLSEEGDSGKPGLKWKCGRGVTKSSEQFYTSTSSPPPSPASPRHSSAVSSDLLVKLCRRFSVSPLQKSVLHTGRLTTAVQTNSVKKCFFDFWEHMKCSSLLSFLV